VESVGERGQEDEYSAIKCVHMSKKFLKVTISLAKKESYGIAIFYLKKLFLTYNQVL
jgi:hypothetical protein